MDKQEAINKVKKLPLINYSAMDFVDKIIEIISQIDEPQVSVMPKFVAEWIEYCKCNEITLLNSLRVSDLVNEWLEVGDNEETFARAWLDGYEIEQEKLYTVEIPNPNKIGNEVNVLMMNGFKQVVIKKEFGDDWKKEKGFQLTESEIKKDFAWAWEFTEEVEK